MRKNPFLSDGCFSRPEELSEIHEIYKRHLSEELCGKLWDSLVSEPHDSFGELPYYRENFRPSSFFADLRENSHRCGCELFSFSLAVYIALTRKMHEKYTLARIDQSIFRDTAESIVLCAEKNREKYGSYGLSDYQWCAKYLALAVFRIGSFEYQPCANPYGKLSEVPAGDMIIKIHVPPRSDMSDAARKASYDAAKSFFSHYFGQNDPVFICESWLLSRHHAALGECNINSFRRDFRIFEEYSDADTGFLSHIFGDSDTSHPEKLADDTRLQRLYRGILTRGESFFSAAGILQRKE